MAQYRATGRVELAAAFLGSDCHPHRIRNLLWAYFRERRLSAGRKPSLCAAHLQLRRDECGGHVSESLATRPFAGYVLPVLATSNPYFTTLVLCNQSQLGSADHGAVEFRCSIEADEHHHAASRLCRKPRL